MLRAALWGQGQCHGGTPDGVEVKHEGEWGSVCSYEFDWGAHWATVVCRQLGCGTAATSSPYAPFGQGTGRIWLHIYFCRGKEEMLQDCSHLGWGQHYCGHEQDVGVTCTGEPGELRLVEGSGPCAGKVEVKLRGLWGVVEDDTWTMEDAEVICQQLGCGSATKAYIGSSYEGSDDRPVNMVMVNCRGHEKAFWECKVGDWGPYSTSHYLDIGVVCQGRRFSRLVGGDGRCSGLLEVRQGRAWAGVCEDAVDLNTARVVCRELGCGSVLTVAGPGLFPMGSEPRWDTGFECTGTELLLSACKRRARSTQGSYDGFRLVNHSSHCAGRVEVMEGGTWGSLCASAWDLPDAHVLCHHLGCGSASSVPPGGSFGSGNGTLRVDAFGCSGTERVPSECPVVGLGEPSCPPGHAAAVECSGVTDSLRLLEGQTRCDGRLEVTTSPGAWAAVSAGLRDPQTGSVACRELGCGEPERVYPVPAPSAMGLQEVQCAGSEDALAQCNRSVTAVAPRQALVVVCSGECPGRAGGCRPRRQQPRCIPSVSRRQPAAEAGGGPRSLCGTPVCQDGWDIPDATVVCRQLRCGAALEASGSAHFGPGAAPPWTGAGGCTGSEASLWDCPAPLESGCRRGGGAAAVCSGHLSLRLTGGSGRCRGHLELLHNGTWGRVCADGTSPATAAAACRQLGCGDWGILGAAPAPLPMVPVRVLGVLLWVQLSVGQPWSTPEPQAELSTTQGSHELRLVGGGGRCAGRVEVKHEGEWGSVCSYDFDWGAHWATVVCRQLGCGTAATSSPYAPFGQGTGRIWLHIFFCRGKEEMLQDCSHLGWGQHYCGHQYDVGVTCTGELGEAGGPQCPQPGSLQELLQPLSILTASSCLTPTPPCPSYAEDPVSAPSAAGGSPHSTAEGQDPLPELLLTLWGCPSTWGGSGLKHSLKLGHGELLLTQHPKS
uniref:Uncharacterized protein n=1 Tax=Melopsittacus undulatus TaxID=13146 RepID=A0A8V5FVD1_MELUD